MVFSLNGVASLSSVLIIVRLVSLLLSLSLFSITNVVVSRFCICQCASYGNVNVGHGDVANLRELDGGMCCVMHEVLFSFFENDYIQVQFIDDGEKMDAETNLINRFNVDHIGHGRVRV